jgi:hypothetical protein
MLTATCYGGGPGLTDSSPSLFTDCRPRSSKVNFGRGPSTPPETSDLIGEDSRRTMSCEIHTEKNHPTWGPFLWFNLTPLTSALWVLTTILSACRFCSFASTTHEKSRREEQRRGRYLMYVITAHTCETWMYFCFTNRRGSYRVFIVNNVKTHLGRPGSHGSSS